MKLEYRRFEANQWGKLWHINKMFQYYIAFACDRHQHRLQRVIIQAYFYLGGKFFVDIVEDSATVSRWSNKRVGRLKYKRKCHQNPFEAFGTLQEWAYLFIVSKRLVDIFLSYGLSIFILYYTQSPRNLNDKQLLSPSSCLHPIA